MKVLSLFDGISCGRVALERAGIPVEEYHAFEIDKYAIQIAQKNYPDLWQLLLKWDSDSPTTFHADGHTVRDFEKRFAAEDKGIIDTSKRFLWKLIENFEN